MAKAISDGGFGKYKLIRWKVTGNKTQGISDEDYESNERIQKYVDKERSDLRRGLPENVLDVIHSSVLSIKKSIRHKNRFDGAFDLSYFPPLATNRYLLLSAVFIFILKDWPLQHTR